MVSPEVAVRPPSSDTYSLLPTSSRSRGALPTFHVCVTAPVDAFMATTVFWPLTAAYTVEPSAENTALPTSGSALLTVGRVTATGLLTEPSAATAYLA